MPLRKCSAMPVGAAAALFLLAALGATACRQQPMAPMGEVMLRSLQFTRSQVAVGQSLVLVAEPMARDEVSPQPVRVSVTSGAQDTAWLTWLRSPVGSYPEWLRSPWDSLSDAELTAVIFILEGRVVIGFKEADAERGVDETGYNITSAETVERMKEWVRQHGISITFEYQLTPTVAATMPADVELVARIRGHENIDLLEPDMPGVYFEASDQARLVGLLAVIASSAGEEEGSLRVRAGDEVSAEYRQSDGSVLRAVASIRG